MAGTSSAGSWFKYGCLGCLGIAALIAVVGGLVVGVAYLQVRSETVEKRSLGMDPRERMSAPAAGTGEGDRPPTGTLSLDLSGGEIELLPGEPGSTIRIDANFDPGSAELEESFEETEDGGWVYRVRFRAQTGAMKALLRGILGKERPSMTVHVPPDQPLNLDVGLARGGGVIELGGLLLDEATFEMTQGGAELRVSRPLKAPMSRMTIKATMGGGSFESLGNASPRTLDVQCTMGGFEIDLTGEWVQDSDISVSATMGGASLLIPRDVNVSGLSTGRVNLSEEEERARPTLTFSQSANMGGVDIAFEGQRSHRD